MQRSVGQGQTPLDRPQADLLDVCHSFHFRISHTTEASAPGFSSFVFDVPFRFALSLALALLLSERIDLQGSVSILGNREHLVCEKKYAIKTWRKREQVVMSCSSKT